MAGKTIGAIRETERYLGNPATTRGGAIRKKLDFSPDFMYMDDAVNDTVKILQREGFKRGEQMAKGFKGEKSSKGMGGGKGGFVNTPMSTPKKGFKN